MKFTDLKNFKPNEMVKRHTVSIAVHKELYEALSDSVKNKKHASKKFQILMLKHFNAKTIAKALNDYDNNNIYAPDYCDYVTVTGCFIQKDYDRFCDIVDTNKFGTVNYCAKILFYWLMQNKVGNNPVVKLPSITANKKSRKRTIRNVNFNHSFTKNKTINLTASKNDKIEINIKIDIK